MLVGANIDGVSIDDSTAEATVGNKLFDRALADLLIGGESVYQRVNEGKYDICSVETVTYGVVAVFSMMLNEQCLLPD